MPGMTQEVWGCGRRFWISYKFPGGVGSPRRVMVPVLASLSVASGHVVL